MHHVCLPDLTNAIIKNYYIAVCGKLQDPQYGDVSQSGITIGSKAKYTCNRGFKLRGNSVRKCQNNGRWSGSKPSCQRVTGKIIIHAPCISELLPALFSYLMIQLLHANGCLIQEMVMFV